MCGPRARSPPACAPRAARRRATPASLRGSANPCHPGPSGKPQARRAVARTQQRGTATDPMCHYLELYYCFGSAVAGEVEDGWVNGTGGFVEEGTVPGAPPVGAPPGAPPGGAPPGACGTGTMDAFGYWKTQSL